MISDGLNTGNHVPYKDFFFHFEFYYYIDVVVFPLRRILILKNYILSPLKLKC